MYVNIDWTLNPNFNAADVKKSQAKLYRSEEEITQEEFYQLVTDGDVNQLLAFE